MFHVSWIDLDRFIQMLYKSVEIYLDYDYCINSNLTRVTTSALKHMMQLYTILLV